METTNPIPHPNTPNRDYDLELAVLEIITAKTGYAWNFTEMAEVCGVSKQAIRQQFHRAKKRIWQVLHRDPALIADLNESRGLDRTNRYFLPRSDKRSCRIDPGGRRPKAGGGSGGDVQRSAVWSGEDS